jgi:AAA+ ATPase superfamily predicted ATPase
MAVRFVGRVAELRALEQFLTKPEPAVGVVYGRRRIGKSLLIQQALAGRGAFTLLHAGYFYRIIRSAGLL